MFLNSGSNAIIRLPGDKLEVSMKYGAVIFQYQRISNFPLLNFEISRMFYIQ